jgi:hypothetical protein
MPSAPYLPIPQPINFIQWTGENTSEIQDLVSNGTYPARVLVAVAGDSLSIFSRGTEYGVGLNYYVGFDPVEFRIYVEQDFWFAQRWAPVPDDSFNQDNPDS